MKQFWRLYIIGSISKMSQSRDISVRVIKNVVSYIKQNRRVNMSPDLETINGYTQELSHWQRSIEHSADCGENANWDLFKLATLNKMVGTIRNL